MLAIVFDILLIVGFIFWFMATWPIAWAERVARGFFLAAVLVFVFSTLSSGGGR